MIIIVIVIVRIVLPLWPRPPPFGTGLIVEVYYTLSILIYICPIPTLPYNKEGKQTLNYPTG